MRPTLRRGLFILSGSLFPFPFPFPFPDWPFEDLFALSDDASIAAFK
ncbi:hypothetical protein HPTD01_1865 [Halomonas sp. TD01]|nr:hypothetical protein GME_18043 [Halomonas sp. TD01]CAH1043387.1 hypothetical protein HPTD01_1865 [Halomonas sp. TD01]